MAGFLAAVTSVTDASGARVDAPRPDGTFPPIQLQLGAGTIASNQFIGGKNIVTVQVDPTFVTTPTGLADLPELRALTPLVDRQVRLVESAYDSTGKGYWYDAGGGAGVSDNNRDVIKPSGVLLAAPGRWRLLPGLASESVDGLLKSEDASKLDSILDDGVFTVQLGGVDDTDAINDAIAAAQADFDASEDPPEYRALREVRMSAGLGVVTDQVIVTRGVRLRGAGKFRTFILDTRNPSTSLADDRTNCTFVVSGAVTALMDTTLTDAITTSGVDYYGAGTRKLSVTDTDALAAAGYFVVHDFDNGIGANGGLGGGLQDELLRADVVASNKITLGWPTGQHHPFTGTGTRYVKSADPAYQCALEDFSIVATHTIAVAVRIDYALRVLARNLSVYNFSRAGIELGKGSIGIDIIDYTNAGACQCAVLGSSVFDVTITGFRKLREGPRANAFGLMRHQLFFEASCQGVLIDDFMISHVVAGVTFRGGRHMILSNGVIDDCDIRTQVIDGYHIQKRGIAIDTGGGEGDLNEIVGPITIANVSVKNCRTSLATATTTPGDINATSQPLDFSVFLHDSISVLVNGLTIDNTGLGTYTASTNTSIDGDNAYIMLGLGVQEVQGEINGALVKGCVFGFGFYAAYRHLRVCDLYVNIEPGSGTPLSIGAWFDQAPTGAGLEMHNFTCEGAIVFGSDFTDPAFEINGVVAITTSKPSVLGPVRVGLNNTGAALAFGDLVNVVDGEDDADLPLAQIVDASSINIHQAVTAATDGGVLFLKPTRTSGQRVNVGSAWSRGDVIEPVNATLLGAVAAGGFSVRPIGIAMNSSSSAGVALLDPPPIHGTDLATAYALAQRDANGASAFGRIYLGSSVATTGTMRVGPTFSWYSVITGPTNAEVVDVASDVLRFGSTTWGQVYLNGQSVIMQGNVLSPQFQTLVQIDTPSFYVDAASVHKSVFDANGWTFGNGNASRGSGVGVMRINRATTAPTSSETAAQLPYTDTDDALKTRSPSGVITTLAVA